MKKLFRNNIFIALLFLSSCAPEKRLARLLARHPELVKTDTIWKTDTIITQGAAKDSTFHFFQTDTVVLKKDNLTVKYFFNHDSTVYLSGKCDPDTIIKMYPVQVNSVEVKKALTWPERIKLWIWDNGWLIALIVFVLWRIFGAYLRGRFPRIFPKVKSPE